MQVFLTKFKVYRSWKLKGLRPTLLPSLSLFVIEFIKPEVIQGFVQERLALNFTKVTFMKHIVNFI